MKCAQDNMEVEDITRHIAKRWCVINNNVQFLTFLFYNWWFGPPMYPFYVDNWFFACSWLHFNLQMTSLLLCWNTQLASLSIIWFVQCSWLTCFCGNMLAALYIWITSLNASTKAYFIVYMTPCFIFCAYASFPDCYWSATLL
jgi:hypothetical protein